jgi:hypothetical protein
VTAVRERPRAAAAAALLVVMLLALAMLAGGALAGGDGSPSPARSSADRSARVRAEHALVGTRRELGALRGQLRDQGAELARAQAAATRWRKRATRAERQLAKARKRGGSRRRSR